MRVVCILLESAHIKEKVADACYRFTPQICLGEKSIFLEIEACKRIYSESSMLMRLQALLKRFDVKVRISIANDIPTALSLANYFGSKTKENLPIDALQFYSSPFKQSRSLEKAIIAFKRLGIRLLGDLKAIPRSTIASRFGKDGLIAIQYLEHAQHIPWIRYHPPIRIVEEEEVDDTYQIKDLEPLLFILRKQIDKALLRLRGAGKLASEVEVRVYLEKYTTTQEPLRTFKIEMSFPQGSVISLLPIIKERMDRVLRVTPLESPVCRIEFEILKSVYGNARQKDFFSKKEEDDEHFKAIVARLTEKLGYEKAFYALPVESYLPEKSWTKSLEEPVSINTPIPERPLRVLRTPLQILRMDNYFQAKGRRWKIIEIKGPERLAGDWWFQEKERDYYRVVTDSGEELWIYLVPETQEHFLHGIFD